MRLNDANIDATGIDSELKKGLKLAGEDLADIDTKAGDAKTAADDAKTAAEAAKTEAEAAKTAADTAATQATTAATNATAARDAVLALMDLVRSTRGILAGVGLVALLAFGAAIWAALSGASKGDLDGLGVEVKTANIQLAADLGQKLADGIMGATKVRHDELVASITTVANGFNRLEGKIDTVDVKMDGLKVAVEKVAVDQEKMVKQTKGLTWHVRQVGVKISAASAPAPAADRSVTFVTADGSRHTVKISEH